MTNVVAVFPSRVIAVDSFADITAKVVTLIEPWDNENVLIVHFDSELTTEEYRLIRRRIRTTPAQEQLENQADAAIAAINNFNQTANASLSNTAVINHVKYLGRVVKGVIKHEIDDLVSDPTPNA